MFHVAGWLFSALLVWTLVSALFALAAGAALGPLRDDEVYREVECFGVSGALEKLTARKLEEA